MGVFKPIHNKLDLYLAPMDVTMHVAQNMLLSLSLEAMSLIKV